MTADWKDVIGGGLLALIGAFVLYRSFGYGIGTPGRMGAGFFPMTLGATAVLLGLAITLRALGREGRLPRPDWRALIAIAGGIALFALTIGPLGLVPAIALAALAGALGDPDARPLQTGLLVVAVALGVWLVFVVGLRLTIPAFRWVY